MHEDIARLIQGEPLEPEAEERALAQIARRDNRELFKLTQRYLGRSRKLADQLVRARVEHAKAVKQAEQAKTVLEEIVQPPLHLGVVLRPPADGRIELAVAGRRQIVGILPELAGVALRAGDEVWLDPGSGVVVSTSEGAPRLGRLGVVSEHLGERIVVRGEADESTVLLCAPELAAQLDAGDRILYSGEVPCVLEAVPNRGENSHWLQTPPRVSFDDIGGLETIVDEVRSELELHIFHRELVTSYDLELMRGMTLVGAPGVGKTLIAKAIAGYVAAVAPDTRFLNVKAGSLRGSLYGQTEQRILELFAAVRAAPGFVVAFFDELDNFGARGQGVSHDIDDRVMGTLLEALDGLESRDNVLVIGATNRLDLIDDAMLRAGRFGDRIVDVPRPSREGTHAILSRKLHAGLPWEDASNPQAAAEAAIAAATSYLHAPRGGGGAVVRVTFADGTQEEVWARQVVSGALLVSGVERAKKAAARRQLAGGASLRADDLTAALDRALAAEARKLSAVPVARRALDLPRAEEIVRVEVPPERSLGFHAQLRAA